MFDWFLHPGSQFRLLKCDEQLIFGRLETGGGLLGLVVESQVDVDLLGSGGGGSSRSGVAAIRWRRAAAVQVVADRGDVPGSNQAEPPFEKWNLGQAGRVALFLENKREQAERNESNQLKLYLKSLNLMVPRIIAFYVAHMFLKISSLLLLICSQLAKPSDLELHIYPEFPIDPAFFLWQANTGQKRKIQR